MSEMSLAQLKALAEAEDKQDTQANVESEVEAEQTEVVGGEESQKVEAVDDEQSEAEETEGEESNEDEPEEWAKPAKGAVPVEKHVELRKKLQSKVHERDDEIARLKAQVEALSKSTSVAQVADSDMPRKPKLSDEDIGYDEGKYAERMAEYTDQLVDYKLNKRQVADSRNAQQEQLNLQVQNAVEEHYERAAELITSGKVTEDNFKSADHIVRKAIDESLPGMGDIVADNIIARLGKGSEKVIYHLGVNPVALSTLKESLKNDPTGFAASIFMGELKARFNSAKIETPKTAIRPDKPLNSTAKTGGSALSKFRAAEKSGDVSGMIAAKRLAREQKIDTSNW